MAKKKKTTKKRQVRAQLFAYEDSLTVWVDGEIAYQGPMGKIGPKDVAKMLRLAGAWVSDRYPETPSYDISGI